MLLKPCSGFSISIHAPRGGSDRSHLPQLGFVSDFNPRSPWGERQYRGREYYFVIVFQSTLPVGGATLLIAFPFAVLAISIHAPRGGSDLLSDFQRYTDDGFQSTLPVGGATSKVGVKPVRSTFQSTLPVGGATKQ